MDISLAEAKPWASLEKKARARPLLHQVAGYDRLRQKPSSPSPSACTLLQPRSPTRPSPPPRLSFVFTLPLKSVTLMLESDHIYWKRSACKNFINIIKIWWRPGQRAKGAKGGLQPIAVKSFDKGALPSAFIVTGGPKFNFSTRKDAIT